MSASWPVSSGGKQAELLSTTKLYTSSAISIATFFLIGQWTLTQHIRSKQVSHELSSDAVTRSELTPEKAETLFEKSHRCGAPCQLRTKWPLALDLVFEAFRTIREKRTLQWFVGWLDRMGPTFELDALGAKVIYTVEPDNIETILSSHFTGKGSKLLLFAEWSGCFTRRTCVYELTNL